MRYRVITAYLRRKAVSVVEVVTTLLGALDEIATALEDASGEAFQLREFIAEVKERIQKEPEDLELARRLLINLQSTIRDLWLAEFKEDISDREDLKEPLRKLESFTNYSPKSSVE